ncbi:MAG TPA: hypothetical protein VN889_00695 [Solirubrobacteraceae bacterium]|nr:hypothetical protein [Solirubrobacteraceae bacterium]
MSKQVLRVFALSVASCALLLVSAAGASAAVGYVSGSSPVVAGGKSCNEPAYATVQGAIDAGAAKVEICPGTYTEQISIANAVKLVAADGTGTATLALPASAQNSASECDTKESLEQIDEISICTSATVSITGVNVRALIPLATCAKGLYGIFVGDDGTLKGSDFTVDGASTTLNEDKGCQHGVSIDVGSKTPAEVGHAQLKKVTSIGYEKNGPTVKGSGSTLAMSASTVTGEGPTPYVAQNGVEVAFGASASIKSSTISANECDYPGVCGPTGEQAAGVLFYQAAAGSKLTSSQIDENDTGIYYASGSKVEPASPDVSAIKDVLTSNRYEGVQLEEGKAALKALTINGSGRVGIELLQSANQESAIESSSIGSRISGQSEASIKVSSDKAAGDIAGRFTFAGGTAAAPVLLDESNDVEVVF